MHVIQSIYPSCTGAYFWGLDGEYYTQGGILYWYPFMSNYRSITFDQIKNFVKGIYYCPIELIKRLTDKGQFQYLTKLKGPQVGNYLYTTQFLKLR